MALPPEVHAKYTGIIDSILGISDLNTISAKRIRQGLQAAVDYDITPQKQAINELILERFDKANSKQPAAAPAPPPPESSPPVTNGFKSEADDGASPPYSSKHRSPSSPASPSPPKKKLKRTTSEDDAAFAARLQAEENSRARPTRGGVVRRRAPVKKAAGAKKKAKSAKKVRAEDDSDVESSSEGEGKEKKRSGAFHKPLHLSPPLADLLGETILSRPQTVKKIWEYVRAHDLQDPNDKRQIKCDDAMKAVFKQDSVHMFTMNKILSHNLYPVDE